MVRFFIPFIIFFGLLSICNYNNSYADSRALSQDDRLPEVIKNTWLLTIKAIGQNNLIKTGELVESLILLRDQANLQSLEEYSLYLIYEAKQALERADRDKAAQYLQYAVDLSPASPSIEGASIPIMLSAGIRLNNFDFNRIINVVFYHTEVSLRMIKTLIYPFLWALTITTYVVFVLSIAKWFPQIIDGIAKWVPAYIRGALAPILASALTIGALFLPPLTCLSVWGFVAVIFLKRRSAIPILAGLTICGWAKAMPLREHITEWLAKDGTISVLRVLSGSFNPNDCSRIESLVRDQPNNPIFRYANAQLLLNSGKLEAAESELDVFEHRLGVNPWSTAVRGLIAFLRGNIDEANNLHNQARDAGLNSADFLFNLYKIKFDQFDKEEAIKILVEARKINPLLVESLLDREKIHSQKSFGVINLPTSLILAYSGFPVNVKTNKITNFFQQIWLTGNSEIMFLVGLLLTAFGAVRFTFFAEVRNKRDSLEGIIGHVVSIVSASVPGACWTLNGYPIFGIPVTFTFIFCLLPLLSWPSELEMFLSPFPVTQVIYAVILFLVAAGHFFFMIERGEE
jgi:hypothetical protein